MVPLLFSTAFFSSCLTINGTLMSASFLPSIRREAEFINMRTS